MKIYRMRFTPAPIIPNVFNRYGKERITIIICAKPVTAIILVFALIFLAFIAAVFYQAILGKPFIA